MSSESSTKEVFAYYGRVMYQAQCCEKAVMNLIALSKHENGITRTQYDETMFQMSQLTFGQLKRMAKECSYFSEGEIAKLDKFHELRDFLTHNYWWERAVEFAKPELHSKILAELASYTDFFDQLNELLGQKSMAFGHNHDVIFDESISMLLSFDETPDLEPFEKLTKNETVVDLFGYVNANNSLIPIFEIENRAFFTLGNTGLTQYKKEIDKDKKQSLKESEDILPIRQFNPIPKCDVPWHYELNLKKKGLKLVVSRDDQNAPVRWKIK